jgi:chloramphenicol-sensitive protein RarD
LATVGVLQYIAPTLQLLVGLTVLNEQLTPATLFGFAMVWTALALYTADSVRSNRAEPART